MESAGGEMKRHCISFFFHCCQLNRIYVLFLCCVITPWDLFQIAQENNIPPELPGCWGELLLHLLIVSQAQLPSLPALPY